MSSLLDEIAGVNEDKDAYDNLPESIKCLYSRREWLWLADKQKASLVRDECVPEAFND